MRFGLDPLHVRELWEFGEDPTIMDPETQNLIEQREDELTLVLLEEGLTLKDFNRSLEINPEGIIEWIRFSLKLQH